ncbi:Flp pilus assembly protein CpaB [Sandaracinobacteroides sp. A072]|uniref:Flp pilus assembly protein CpaB n=1 Tax=Sandaracinobacteroides sp. A072 TaxID=3461146 RepID=UPI004043344C
MRRSSIFLLLGAVLLGLVAVLAARMFLVPDKNSGQNAAPKTYVVVASKPLKFGDKVALENVKAIAWPGALPSGGYGSVKDAIGDGSRSVLRDIAANEPILATALTGDASRLASSKLLGPNMRAVSLPLSETAGAGGFIAPGDRVDVILTRTLDQDNVFATVVVQGVRVLGVGQINDTANSQPVVVKSATIEVTPEDAQRIAMAQNVGVITLALRGTGDESQTPLPTLSVSQLQGGVRRVSQPTQSAPAESAPAQPAAQQQPVRPSAVVLGRGPSVTVVRGTEPTSYRVAQ